MTNAVSAYWPHSYYQGGITLVGIVIVSHSQKLAEGVKELAEMMANNVHIEAAGGLDEGLLGTSYERVKVAIEDVCGTDGAVVLMDMGSAVMTAELAVEEFRDEAVRLVDCPIAEGAVLAALAAASGAGLDEVVRRAESSRHMEKIVRP